MVWDSLNENEYILKEGRSKNYIPTVYTDLKYKISKQRENEQKHRK